MSSPELIAIRQADVIVVGAGLSGLIAARRLRRRGMTVCVLEARDRIGGRIRDYRSRAGNIYPLGAEWLGTEEEALHALLTEFGIKTTPQYNTGRFAFETAQKLQYVESTDAVRLGTLAIPQDELTQTTLEIIQRLDEMSYEVPLEAPHLAPRAAEWDQMTALEWCEQNIADAAALARFVFIARDDPMDLDKNSLLYYLFMRRSVTRQILDDRRLLGGTYQLCEALSRELGSAVRLSSPVTAISQDEAGVQVTSPSGVYHSRAVIVATAVGCVTQIAYTPQLPAELRALWAHGVLGPVIKCVIIYKDAFWRAANLSGMAFSELGPLISCCDASPENGSEAALVGFIRGSQAHLWAPQAQSERRAAVLAQLTRLFGAAASRPIEYFDQCWPAADFPGGSYCVHLPPGVLSRNGQALRQPVGRIHWAGTETETNWNGGMEGAIRAGERAAAEVYARHIA